MEKARIARVEDFPKLSEGCFQFAFYHEQAADYFVPEGVCSQEDLSGAQDDLIQGFINARRVTPPCRFVAYLRDCYVLPNAAVVTASGYLIAESCFPYSSPWLTKLFAPWIEEAGDGQVRVKLDPVEQFECPVLYCREHGEQGFFHWMHSVLPRLDVLTRHRLGGGLALLYRAEQSFQLEGLKIAGLGDRPVIAPAAGAVQYFRELLFPSPLVEMGDFWLRSMDVGPFYDSLPASTYRKFRRVYVTRRGAEVRRLKNERQVTELLEQRGFVVVECGDHRFAEQLAIFRGCEFMIGAHGAGLSHAISMAPGSRLLEILHPRRHWATYRAISARRGVHYGFVVGKDPGPEIAGDAFDFEVDTAKLTQVICKLS